jgi:hypothetical protein
VSIAVFASNFFFRAETDYFGTEAEENPLLHTWSLAVEEQYYFVFPLLLAAIWGFGRWRIGLALSALAAISLLFSEWHVRLNPEQIFFDTRARIWELLAGALVALFLARPQPPSFGPRIRQIGSLGGFGLIVYALLAFHESTESPGLPIVIPVLGAMLIIVFSTPSTLVGRFLGSRPLVGIGLISYSAYLWHQPLLAFVRLRTAAEPSALSLAAAGVAALVLAYPTWRYIEQPFRARATLGRRAVFSFAAATTLGLATLGGIGIWQRGFPNRFQSETEIVQTFQRLQAERATITRSGECQFNPKTKNNTYSLFLRNWRCHEDPTHPDLQKIGIIVVGDSHSADMASALRANGYSPAQIGGPGCSVVPSRMGKGCRAIFNFIRDFATKNPQYTHIILANRWETKELRKDQLTEMISYWSLPGKKLVFVTSRPEFPGYKRALRLGHRIEPRMDRANNSSAPEVIDLLTGLNVAVVNAGEIFCALTPHCDWKDPDGRHLTTDGHHLTRYGAELFGRRMLSLGVLPVPTPDVVATGE